MISQLDRESVEDFIQVRGGPKAVSLSDGTHLFHFSDAHWSESPVILVNKNGNHMRVIREADQRWTVVKTWSSLFELVEWAALPHRRDTAEQAIALISDGPGQGKSETLCYFPKEAFSGGGRRVVWRYHILRARTDLKAGTFTILYNVGGDATAPYAGVGKPWESREAAAWCMKTLPRNPPIEVPGLVENPYERKAALAAAMEDLQDNPLWGAF